MHPPEGGQTGQQPESQFWGPALGPPHPRSPQMHPGSRQGIRQAPVPPCDWHWLPLDAFTHAEGHFEQPPRDK